MNRQPSAAPKPVALNAWLESLAERIERRAWLDRPADLLARAATPLAARRVRDLLSGTPIGHPLHPLLVAVPIGSWTAAAAFDALGDPAGARRATLLGLLAVAPSALSGLSDWRYTAGAERRVGLIHAALNVLATGTYGVSWWLRGRGHTRAGVACSLVGAASLAGSGWLGGHLAYALGVGVDTTAFQHGLAEWTDVAAEADVPPEAPLGVEIDGVPVVLFRSAEHGISALADRCTHRGGPLHEGTTRDGAVVCPWHGSCFSATGAVVSGPATRPQPRYAVRVEAGRVLVGRTDEVRSLRVRPAGR